MTLNEYQIQSKATAIYPPDYSGLYPILGLCGESGEVAELMKKAIRDGKPTDFYERLAKELGDVLWYISAIATDYNLSLEDIAAGNLSKLADRKNRGVISGCGDNR